jgi:hypothetical protein
MTIARHVFDPATGRAIFVTPDDPSLVGLDAPIGSLANKDAGGRFWSKFGGALTDWTEFATTSGFLPLSGGSLNPAASLTVPADLTVGQRIALTGSVGGFGGAVRYIGVGGSTSTIYHNVPTGGGHSFAVNEVSQVSITTAGISVSGSGVTLQSAQPVLGWSPSGVGIKWLQYMTSSADANLYVRDMVNSRMHVTYVPGATSAAASTQILSNLTVGAALAITGALTGVTNLGMSGGISGVTTIAASGNISANSLTVAANTALVFSASSNADLHLSGAGQFRIVNAAYSVAVFTINNAGAANITGTLGVSSDVQTSAGKFIGAAAKLGRDNASFLVGNYGNSFTYGHSNTEYRATIGAMPNAGYPALLFYSYFSGTLDEIARSGTNTRPARMYVNINGGINFDYGPQTGTPDTTISWTSMFQISPGAIVATSAYIDAGDITNGYRLNGITVLGRNATYTNINDGAGGVGLLIGSTAGDPRNYYRNGEHLFQNRAGSATYLTLASSQITATLDVAAPSFTESTTGRKYAPIIVSTGAPSGTASNGTIWIQV